MSDFLKSRLTTKPLGRALARGKIARSTYNEIISRKSGLEHAMKKIETASEVTPFPPTHIIPEGIYDFEYNIVVHAHPTLLKMGKFVYLIIELSCPSILYMDKSMFLGLLAHEFLHYVVYTIDFHRELTERSAKGDGKSQIVIGLIPNKEKMTLDQRDRYFYGNPEVWFKDKEVIQAVGRLESERCSSQGRALADRVMEWMNGNRLMKEFERGKVVGYKGEIILHQPIIEEAKKLKIL
jgi:hypothetical protein